MLIDWFTSKFGSNSNARNFIEPGEGHLNGLNLKSALDAHDAWKTKLQLEINGESQYPLDVSTIAGDCHCELGKWLHGEGKKAHSKRPEYQKSLAAHAEFHITAAEVVIEYQSGNRDRARQLLNGKFRTASNNNQLELVRLFSVAKQ
jgi:hypothetical protein